MARAQRIGNHIVVPLSDGGLRESAGSPVLVLHGDKDGSSSSIVRHTRSFGALIDVVNVFSTVPVSYRIVISFLPRSIFVTMP